MKQKSLNILNKYVPHFAAWLVILGLSFSIWPAISQGEMEELTSNQNFSNSLEKAIQLKRNENEDAFHFFELDAKAYPNPNLQKLYDKALEINNTTTFFKDFIQAKFDSLSVENSQKTAIILKSQLDSLEEILFKTCDNDTFLINSTKKELKFLKEKSLVAFFENANPAQKKVFLTNLLCKLENVKKLHLNDKMKRIGCRLDIYMDILIPVVVTNQINPKVGENMEGIIFTANTEKITRNVSFQINDENLKKEGDTGVFEKTFTKSGKYPLNVTALLKNPIKGTTRVYEKTFEVNVE
jgi:hypothetical protein